MKLFDPLYARDSKGKILNWIISVDDLGLASRIIVNEGLLDGKYTPTYTNVRKGKNIGKMNETSHYEQACSQAESKWTKKKKQGYKSLQDLGISLMTDLEAALPINRTDANNISKPMKAQKYFKDDGSVRIKFPCFGQPKLNGFRVIARWESVKENIGTLLETETYKVVFRSKEGLVYSILEHIEREFVEKMFFISGQTANGEDAKEELAFDGEMYIEGEILSEISSAVRKRNSKTEKLKFHIFDLAVEKMTQRTRTSILNLMKDTHFKNCNSIQIVETCRVETNEIAQTLTDAWIKEGYEGGIFRDTTAHYQFGKRPQTMTKLKRSQDKEFKITDVVGGDNTPDVGVFVCLAENGKTFKCTPEGTTDQKKEYLSNKSNYIGKLLTVRFFERTIEQLPFHAVGVTIRDYE